MDTAVLSAGAARTPFFDGALVTIDGTQAPGLRTPVTPQGDSSGVATLRSRDL